MNKSSKKFILHTLLGAGILLIFLTLVGWGEIISAIRGATPRLLFLGLLAGVLANLVRGFVWKSVFDSFGYRYTLSELFKIYYTGAFANGVTPVGMAGGEPFVAYLTSKKHDLKYEEVLGAIFSSDIMIYVPFLTLSVLGLFYFLTLYHSQPILSLLAAFILLPSIIIILFFLGTWHKRDLVKKAAVYIEKFVKTSINFIKMRWDEVFEVETNGVDEKVERFYESFEFAFSNKSAVAEAVIISHLSRVLDVASLYAFILAMGIGPSFLAVFFLVPMAGLGFFLPLPGGLGSQQLILSILLVLIANVPLSVASASVLLYRLSTYGVVMVVGGVFASKMSKKVLG